MHSIKIQLSIKTVNKGVLLNRLPGVVWMWCMNKWMQLFAYRITPYGSIVMTVGCTAQAIALLTVGGKAVKAALANLVENLRNK